MSRPSLSPRLIAAPSPRARSRHCPTRLSGLRALGLGAPLLLGAFVACGSAAHSDAPQASAGPHPAPLAAGQRGPAVSGLAALRARAGASARFDEASLTPDGQVRAFTLPASVRLGRADFVNAYRADFGLGEDDTVVEAHSEPEALTDASAVVTRYRHLYRGVPVDGSWCARPPAT